MSSYSPERFQELFARVVRPFKPALLERSLALSEIVRRRSLTALEGQPGAQADQDEPREPGHDVADACAQTAAAEPAHDVAVSDQPGQQPDLELADTERGSGRPREDSDRNTQRRHRRGSRAGGERVADDQRRVWTWRSDDERREGDPGQQPSIELQPATPCELVSVAEKA